MADTELGMISQAVAERDAELDNCKHPPEWLEVVAEFAQPALRPKLDAHEAFCQVCLRVIILPSGLRPGGQQRGLVGGQRYPTPSERQTPPPPPSDEGTGRKVYDG